MSKDGNPAFPVNDQNRVKRVPNRGAYDRDSVYQILDASPIGHVSFISDDKPFAIPMLFGRRNDELLFHGATKSRLMQVLSSGHEICVTVAMVDGLVLAKSLFHHSMNYRSVAAFGCGRRITDSAECMDALRNITDKTMPGRWDDCRLPNPQEMKATMVVAVKIETASAKTRVGSPIDDPEDQMLPYWSGEIPIQAVARAAIPDQHTQAATPPYVERWIAAFNR